MSRLFLSLSLLLTASCSVKIKDVKACATAGVFSAGADCVTSISGLRSELSFDEWLEFLEPQPEKKLPDGTVVPERGSAICVSSDDWTALKTAIMKLCEKVGSWCTKEAKEEIQRAEENVAGLQTRVMRKKKKLPPPAPLPVGESY